MKKVRIFISSPGDVMLERTIARNVISEFSALYSKYAQFEVLMWEDFPLSADSTFQEGINYFITQEPIDIAVFVLWSRLGTPLCTKFKKADGTPYKSGTEYEFDLMMKLRSKTNHPTRVLTYVKKSNYIPEKMDLKEMRDFLQQKDNLNAFLQEYFHDEETNSNYAYMPFGENISFDQAFRTHMKKAIEDIVGNLDALKEWEGNPYVGLNSFEFNQQSIFFGRKQLIYETASNLTIFEGDQIFKKNLIVLGESGSGKSSFVKAGLLPIFCGNGNVNGGDYEIVTPSMYGGNMYQGLLDLLQSKLAFMRNHPFLEQLRGGINNDTNFGFLSYELERQKIGADLIIYIDQFEELFSDNQITEEERQRVIYLLRGLSQVKRIALFLSMRSDFYNRFSLYEELSQIKENSYVVDLPVMGPTEIAEIIEEPARKACLKWEIDDKGHSLNSRIVKDAVVIKDLPLIEFALSELYEARNEADVLTRDSYERIGGLKGAIVSYADRCYSQLNEQEKQAFNDILGFVITESASHKDTYVRKTSLRSDVEKSDMHKNVIDKMLRSRLFVSGKDSLGNPTITITHEILLKSWGVLAQWIEREREFISSSRYYEQAAKHWEHNGFHTKDLISGRSSLLEAEYYHFKNNSRIPGYVLRYLDASFRKEQRGGLVWRIMALLMICVNAIVIAVSKISGAKLDVSMIDDASAYELLMPCAAYIIVLLNGVWLRIRSLPEYKTIKGTILAWSLSTLIMAALMLVYLGSWSDVISIFVLLVLPLLSYTIIEIFEYRRRLKWKGGFVSFRVSDEFWLQFRTAAYVVIFFLVLFGVGVLYYNSLEEERERVERQAAYTDEVFDLLEQAESQFSNSDNVFLSNLRKNYLETFFWEDLQDTICDDRDLQYARVLYNLKQPQKSLVYLYPDDYWNHHLHWAFSKYHSYCYEDAKRVIQLYVDGNRADSVSVKINYSNLIWPSEVCGLFDCAEKLDSMAMARQPDFQTQPGAWVNRGHIPLSRGDVDGAVQMYMRAIRVAENLGYVGEYKSFFTRSIENDFHLFSRFGVIPDSDMKRVSDMLGLKFVPAYVPMSCVDSVENAELHEWLVGDWECDLGGIIITLNVDDEDNLFYYLAYNEKGEEVHRALAECRFGRVDGDLLWDEFDSYTDDNSVGRIVEMEKDRFVLQIVENRNPEDKGTLRTYTRVKENVDE